MGGCLHTQTVLIQPLFFHFLSLIFLSYFLPDRQQEQTAPLLTLCFLVVTHASFSRNFFKRRDRKRKQVRTRHYRMVHLDTGIPAPKRDILMAQDLSFLPTSKSQGAGKHYRKPQANPLYQCWKKSFIEGV